MQQDPHQIPDIVEWKIATNVHAHCTSETCARACVCCGLDSVDDFTFSTHARALRIQRCGLCQLTERFVQMPHPQNKCVLFSSFSFSSSGSECDVWNRTRARSYSRSNFLLGVSFLWKSGLVTSLGRTRFAVLLPSSMLETLCAAPPLMDRLAFPSFCSTSRHTRRHARLTSATGTIAKRRE